MSLYIHFYRTCYETSLFSNENGRNKNITTIASFLENELDILKTKQRKPIEINQRAIEEFIDMDIDYGKVNDVCEKWNLVFESEGEGKK